MRVVVPWVLVMVLAAAGALPAAGQSGIQIVVNGTPVSLPGPAMLQAGEVMVPAVRVIEAFGATAVWQPSDRVILITSRGGRTVRLKIGEDTAVVNGQARALPVAPMVIAGVVHVPAAPVLALLGAWVRFDAPSQTLHVASQITALHLRRGDGAARVVLDATGPLRAETRTLNSPDRLVVDLHGGAFRPPDQDLTVGGAGVARVRAGQFQVKPYVTRVVFDLQQAVDARVTTAPDSFAVTIEVRPRGATLARAAAPATTSAVLPPLVTAPPYAPPAAAPPPADPPAIGPEPGMMDAHGGLVTPPPAADPLPDDGVPRILQVRIEQPGGRFRVVVEVTMPTEYHVRELLDPDRLVLDLNGAVFVPVKQEIPVAGAVVTEVRAAQFQTSPNVTRVVIVLKRKAAYTVHADGGNAVIIDIPDATSLRGQVIAIDAGHGGKDTGAIGPTGLLEKDVVLDIAQRVREQLVRSGVRVVMTREVDAFVELPDRPRTARQQGANAFVSIHANASTRPVANGAETYYLSPQSQQLAQMVQEELARVPGLIGRGVKTANFLVLRESDMPAILVEVAYISNPDEEARLRQDAFKQRLAEAIVRGIQRFLLTAPVPAN